MVLVRPARRTFARLALRDYGVGAAEDRTGWPAGMWEITALRVDPAGVRLRVSGVPLGEAGVLRWVGPAQALARLPDPGVALSARQLGATAVVPVPPRGDTAAVNFIMQWTIAGLRTTEVALSRLALPPGYSEAPWPRTLPSPATRRRVRR